LVCFCSHLLNALNFLLACANVRDDRVLGVRDVARRVIAPGDRIAKLLLMCLHRLSCALDGSTS
jgi:hypothetical protein